MSAIDQYRTTHTLPGLTQSQVTTRMGISVCIILTQDKNHVGYVRSNHD